MGENNALLQSRKEIIRDVVYGASAIYQSLFACQDEPGKVVSTFEFINFLGWKYHESQQKPKKRGSAEFSLKTLQQEIDESTEGTGSKGVSSSGSIEVSDSDSEEEGRDKKKPDS